MMYLRRSAAILFTAAILTTAPLTIARAQDANTVVLKNFDYSPMMLTIKAGASVTWKNLDGEPHTVVSVDDAFRSPALDQDDTFTFRFDKPGIYKYICSIHPKMKAMIVVE